MKRALAITILFVVLLTACAPQASGPAKAELPAGKAWAEGKEIYFVHTETSNKDVADLLTDMMKSPVIYVPSLREVPEEALANVYVFNNGIEGMGPFGFQADVFDNPPGTDGYSPLRRLNVVTWTDESKARLLTSTEEILAAEAGGEVSIDRTSEVINMPFITWDGGKR